MKLKGENIAEDWYAVSTCWHYFAVVCVLILLFSTCLWFTKAS